MNNFIRNNFLSCNCTICSKITEEIYQHSLLKVIICKKCHDDVVTTLNQSEISYCCWCTRDKELLACVKCNYKCCYDCITRNLGGSYIDSVNEKNWLCFVCDANPIESLQKEYYKFNKLMRNEIEPLAPEGAASSIDITSPYILVDESEDSFRKFCRKSVIGSQDLDSILNMYEKQIKASLELDDANVPSILSEINSIKTEHLSTAIHSLKKCLSAFASDLTNLESRVTQAVTTNNQLILSKLTSLLRILIQHHIFNRLSHPQARIKDDLMVSSNTKSSSSSSSSNNVIVIPPVNNINNNNSNQKMVLFVDPKYLKNTKKMKLSVEKLAVDFNSKKSKDFTINDLSRIINTYASSNNKRSVSMGGNSSIGSVKRVKLYGEDSSESVELKADRQRRSLITPSWLSDFKIEKENDNIQMEGKYDDDDGEWTDYRFKYDQVPRKRGRPPKYPKSSPSEMNNDMSDMPKRARGRPKKILSLNDKQPRFYIPKLNGDALLTIENDI